MYVGYKCVIFFLLLDDIVKINLSGALFHWLNDKKNLYKSSIFSEIYKLTQIFFPVYMIRVIFGK